MTNCYKKSAIAMNNKVKTTRTVAIVVAAILIVDQVVKLLVKTNMQIGEDIRIFDWFHIHFIENEGFAFGMALGGAVGKILLSVVRLVASVFIVWLIARLIRRDGRRSLIYSLALIVAGAVGNLIDSCFYGLIFNESYYSVATLFPPEGGYGYFLQGRVVDMFYFPLFELDWPQWMPILGGQHFEFFNAIFNVADAAITIGIIWLMIDQFLLAPKAKKEELVEKSSE